MEHRGGQKGTGTSLGTNLGPRDKAKDAAAAAAADVCERSSAVELACGINVFLLWPLFSLPPPATVGWRLAFMPRVSITRGIRLPSPLSPGKPMRVSVHVTISLPGLVGPPPTHPLVRSRTL